MSEDHSNMSGYRPKLQARPTTPSRLDEIEARLEALTEGCQPGPWHPVYAHAESGERILNNLDNAAGDASFPDGDDVAMLLNELPWLLNVARAAEAYVEYWDKRTVLWDAVGRCGHDPNGQDCPEMDALREQGSDAKMDRALRKALSPETESSEKEGMG